jgi:hypothetical protein
MARIVRTGLALSHNNEIEGERMSGLEGQAALAQSSERPQGRPFNPGVPRASATRKGRRGRPR